MIKQNNRRKILEDLKNMSAEEVKKLIEGLHIDMQQEVIKAWVDAIKEG